MFDPQKEIDFLDETVLSHAHPHRRFSAVVAKDMENLSAQFENFDLQNPPSANG